MMLPWKGFFKERKGKWGELFHPYPQADVSKDCGYLGCLWAYLAVGQVVAVGGS